MYWIWSNLCIEPVRMFEMIFRFWNEFEMNPRFVLELTVLIEFDLNLNLNYTKFQIKTIYNYLKKQLK